MYLLDVQQEFDAAAALIRHRQLSADMPAGLAVARSNLKWTNAWDYFIGQSPKAFYETISRNIAGNVSVYLNFMETDEENFSIDVKQDGRFVFKVENRLISDGRGKTLRFEEWVNKNVDSHNDSGRQGIGLNLFRNIFEAAERGGIDLIQLRAGKADGKYFWARHGFYLRDEFFRQRMVQQVLNNVALYSDTLPGGIEKTVRDIVAEGGLDMCWKIARLEGALEGKPLGWKLLEGDNPEYSIDLHNPEQVARVKASFVRPAVSVAPVPVPHFS